MKSQESKIYDFIVNNDIATSDEINLVTNISGYSVETLNAIIYCRTLYHDAEQCLICAPDVYTDICGDFTEDDDEE